MRALFWILIAVFFISIALVAVRYSFLREKGVDSGDNMDMVSRDMKGQEIEDQFSSKNNSSEENPDWRVEEVVNGLDTPWSIVFTSAERMLVTERAGRLRVVENGVLKPEPLHVFQEVQERGEEGLMSLALSPQYPSNHFIYVSLAYPSEERLFVKVMRWKDEGAGLGNPEIIIDKIPAAQFHAGCRIAFGPDGKLYVTTGDATNKALPQDKNSLVGKILRLNPDGSIPEDNPFSHNPVWSYGHRNSQGIAWRDDTQAMYATEHGPSGFDGPGGGDELNRIIKGENYGWPLVSHQQKREGIVSPLLVFTPAEAPAALLSYSGRIFPAWRGDLFFGALRGEGIVRVVFDKDKEDVIEKYEKLSIGSLGRIREVMEGPDGFLYFATSNRDGRGNPTSSDDRIFRIRPR